MKETSVGWNPIAVTPPTGVLLDVITPGGDERQLIFERRLWWLPDRAMYVYFVPTHWRRADPPAKGLRR